MNPLNFVAVILKVLLVNLLAALKFDKVFYNKKNVLKIKKTLKNVTEIKKTQKLFFTSMVVFTPPPIRGARSIVMSASVCLCVSVFVCPRSYVWMDGWNKV